MSTFANEGGTFVAKLMQDFLAAQNPVGKWYLAIGEGNPGWDNLDTIPAAAPEDTGLVAHVGHFVAAAQYVVPAPDGSIRAGGSERYNPSAEPTRHIHLFASVDFADAPTATIRELAVYFNATPDTGHEAQSYLPAPDLADLGVLITQSRRRPWQRTPDDQGSLSFVYRVGE